MIMEWAKDRKLDVYCLFRNDGIVLPVKLRLFDEDGVRQEFCIHRYKLIDGAGKENVPKAEMFRRTTVTFDCVIEVFGRERILRLMYASSDMQWLLLDIR